MPGTIGERIKNLREHREWSQRDLAERVDINYSVLNRIELGKRPVKDHEILKFADVFGVDSDYLIGKEKRDEKRNTDSAYNSLAAITELAKKYGLDQLGFFDIEEWKNLSPEEIKMLDAQFRAVAKMAKERNEEK